MTCFEGLDECMNIYMLQCWAVKRWPAQALQCWAISAVSRGGESSRNTVEGLTRGVCCFLCLSEAILLGLNVCSEEMSLLGRATACRGCLRTTQEQWFRIGLQNCISPHQRSVELLLKRKMGRSLPKASTERRACCWDAAPGDGP